MYNFYQSTEITKTNKKFANPTASFWWVYCFDFNPFYTLENLFRTKTASK